MPATDTGSLIAYFGGGTGSDVALVQSALTDASLSLPPVVITELLSDPKTAQRLEPVLANWPLLDLTPGYWVRAGATRALLIAKGLRPKVPDTLIAQSCI